MKRLEIVGQKINRWTVVEYSYSKYNKAHFKCICECGNIGFISGSSLISGNSKSCGCYHKDVLTTHGDSKSVEYKAWSDCINRCYDEDHAAYKNYGARGIKVSERWLSSYENFLEDMGRKPTSSYTLERVDVNGDYCIDNCVWATAKVQTRNRRNTLKVLLGDNLIPLIEYAEIFKIPYQFLHNHVKLLGRNPEEARVFFYAKKYLENKKTNLYA